MAYQTTDSFTVVSFHLYVIVGDWYVISTASTTISQRPLFVEGRLGRGKNDGNDDGKKKEARLFPLPIVHRELFFSLFLLEYRAEAPAKDYVHHFPCFFTKTATVLKGFRVLVTKWLWLHFRTLFHGKQVRNDWEICWFQLSFMVLYLIWNEISHFWFVKTRKRQIDIELFCSLLSGHCVDQFYPANQRKSLNLVKASWLWNLSTRKKTDTKESQKYIFHC